MKRFIHTILINFSFLGILSAQSSKTVFNNLGVVVSYSYESVGTVTNEKTGTKFTKYKLHGTIKNTSNNYFDVKGKIEYEFMKAMQLVSQESDKTFIWNNSLGSIDHVFCGQKSGYFPNDGLAHLFVIAPNSQSDCEVEFVYPQASGGTPIISYTGHTIYEVKGTPEEPKQPKVIVKQAEWSPWKSAECFGGLQYRVKKYETWNLNQQYHYYFEFKNNYKQRVYFDFDLLGDNNKKEFGDRHTISPGQIIEFNHKMTHNYIKGSKLWKLCFGKDDKKYAECNDNGDTKNQNESSFKDLLDKWNALCQQADQSDDQGVKLVQKSNCLTTAKNYEDNESNRRSIQSSIDALEASLKQAGNDAGLNEIASLSARRNELCKQVSSINKNTYNNICDNNQEGRSFNPTKQQSLAYLKEDIRRLEMIVNSHKAEEDRLEKEKAKWIAKTTNFSNLMKEGLQLESQASYDLAISKYNEAKNLYTGEVAPQEKLYAKNAIKQADDAIARAEKAKADAARKIRLEEQKKKDKKEDDVFGTAVDDVSGLMTLLTDRYPYKSAYFKLRAGVGYESLPLVVNNAKQGKTEVTNSTHPGVYLGAKIGLFNNNQISLHLTPFINYGINALSNGNSGVHISTGGSASLWFGAKSTSTFKLFAEGAYTDRVGEYTYDEDAVAGGNSATDNVKKGEYKYNVLRYGGGFMLHFVNRRKLKETFIKPGIFFEKFSFASASSKPVMVFNLEFNIESTIFIEAAYSQNYAIGGKPLYPYTFTTGNKDFWSVKIIKQGAF